MKENQLYETELPLQEVLEKMRKNTYYNFHNYSNSSINKDYLSLRTSIFKILQKITMKMGFKSQTYFLSAYYLDIIFMKKKKISINLYKIGLAALCLSAKYCENDPIVPQLQYFIRVYNTIMGYKNIISMSDLMYAEVLVCKLLNYKLNYYTIYDFNSFFFCHGILKFEQIKEIENDFKKNNDSNNKINVINTLFVKNILGKIYKKSRDYLDIIIKSTKICFKYSPLYITVFLIKQSIEEILVDEYKKIFSKDSENYENKKEEFCNKNYSFYKEVMNNFYKIDYESSEQYKQLIIDEEIKKIFNQTDKNDNKKKDKNEEDNNQNKKKEDKDNNENNKIFNNTVTNGFYKRLKIRINSDVNNNKSVKNTINDVKNINNNEIDKPPNDLDSNLNIDEFKKSQILKDNKINNTNKLNKIPIPRINTCYAIENSHKNIINKNDSIKTDSPFKFKKIQSNKFLNFKKINKTKKLKLKVLNEKVNHTFDNNENNEIPSTKNNIKKKPYLKKLITLNNKDTLNPPNNIKASTATHFYSSKINSLPSSSGTIASSLLNSQNISINGNSKNKNRYSYISSFYRANKIGKNNNKKFINTSIGARYKKKILNHLNNNDISREIKNEIANTDEIKDININDDKDGEKIKSSTSDNFYPNNFKKISVNTTKESEMKNININKEIQTKKLSLVLSKKNSELNNTLKEINKSFGKNIIYEYNKKGCSTSRNNDNSEGLNLNMINNNNKAMKYKKLDINKFIINNNNISINVNKNNKIIKKTKNNSINIPGKSKPIIQQLSFRNSTKKTDFNSLNDGSLTSREHKIKNLDKDQNKLHSSIYQIIKKTKNLFVGNKKEEEKLTKDTKNLPTNNFYKSQQNFYKTKDKIIKNKNEEKIKQQAYVKNAINKVKINNKKIDYQNNKNSSTIIINNNININIGNKKTIKIPQLNLNNAILNSNDLNSKCNTQRNSNVNNIINFGNKPNTKRKNINNMINKLPFNKKVINKTKK